MNLLFLAIIHYNMRQTALFMNYAKIKCISKSKIQLFLKAVLPQSTPIKFLPKFSI